LSVLSKCWSRTVVQTASKLSAGRIAGCLGAATGVGSGVGAAAEGALATLVVDAAAVVPAAPCFGALVQAARSDRSAAAPARKRFVGRDGRVESA
jgi:hypothetical protein